MTVSQSLPQGSFVLLSQKGGIFREAPTRRRCSTVNPLSAMTESPLTNGKFRNPDLVTIFLSEKWPANKSWLTKGKAPPGEIPTNPFSVVWFLYELKSSLFIQRLLGIWQQISVQSMMTLVDGYLSLKSTGMCWSTLVLDCLTRISKISET